MCRNIICSHYYLVAESKTKGWNFVTFILRLLKKSALILSQYLFKVKFKRDKGYTPFYSEKADVQI